MQSRDTEEGGRGRGRWGCDENHWMRTWEQRDYRGKATRRMVCVCGGGGGEAISKRVNIDRQLETNVERLTYGAGEGWGGGGGLTQTEKERRG